MRLRLDLERAMSQIDHGPSARRQGTAVSRGCTSHPKSESPEKGQSHSSVCPPVSVKMVEERTGMPDEQEMPAPVTSTIRLLLATVSDKSTKARRVDCSLCALARSKVTVIAVRAEPSGGRSRSTETDLHYVHRVARDRVCAHEKPATTSAVFHAQALYLNSFIQ